MRNIIDKIKDGYVRAFEYITSDFDKAAIAVSCILVVLIIISLIQKELIVLTQREVITMGFMRIFRNFVPKQCINKEGHEWVYHDVIMPNGYWRPSHKTCSKCSYTKDLSYLERDR